MNPPSAANRFPRLLNDYHVHTYLARCCHHKDTQTPANIIARAEKLGFDSIGLSEHCHYPEDIHVLEQLVADLSKVRSSIRVFAGCEADYVGNGQVSLSLDEVERLGLDYVVLAVSHFHIGHVPKPDRPGARAAGEHWLAFLREGIQSGLADIIAHPVLNLGNALGDTDEIIATLSDADILAVLAEAEQLGIAMDVNPRLFTHELWGAQTQIRFYRLCHQAGVRIAPASDAHQLDQIGDTLKLEPWAERIGLSNDDFIDADWLAARRERVRGTRTG